MTMTDAYVVTAPVVVVNIAGDLRYLYQGAPVPASVDAEHLASLIDIGFVKPVSVRVVENADGTDTALVIPDGEPDKSWTVKVLQGYAERESIEIPSSAKTKDDILAVLAKRADPSTNTDGEAPAELPAGTPAA